jgi:hypothetical protein
MDVLAQLYPNTSKDIQRLGINIKKGLEQDWEINLTMKKVKRKNLVTIHEQNQPRLMNNKLVLKRI